VSRDISAGIVMSYGLNVRGSIPDMDNIIFSFPQCRDRLWDPAASYPMGTGGSFPPPIAEIKNALAIRSLTYVFSCPGACLIKHGENFPLPYLFILYGARIVLLIMNLC
jgi:hypothetical protein